MRQGRRAFVGALAVLASAPTGGQSAPMFATRPIRVVPFGTAGGPIDALAAIGVEIPTPCCSRALPAELALDS